MVIEEILSLDIYVSPFTLNWLYYTHLLLSFAFVFLILLPLYMYISACLLVWNSKVNMDSTSPDGDDSSRIFIKPISQPQFRLYEHQKEHLHVGGLEYSLPPKRGVSARISPSLITMLLVGLADTPQ